MKRPKQLFGGTSFSILVFLSCSFCYISSN